MGGFGTVFKAKNKFDKKYYAIKKIQILSQKDRYIKRLIQEV